MPPTATTRRPLVSAVVAAYNAGPYIEACLGSLCRQSVDDLEILVVDDGSTDATPSIVEQAARRDRRIRLLPLRRNRGQGAALNVGAAEARGRYLAVLDADDEATPSRLERQLAAFEREKKLVLVGGAVQLVCGRHGEAGAVWRYAPGDGAIRARSLFKSELISGAMTFDREVLARHGLRFHEGLRLGVDWAMSIQAMRLGRVANLEDVVMKYRIHPGQLTDEMPDDLASDSARIRVEYLDWLGVRPTDEELRTHLAISPCNYWPFGSHPFFEERRASIAHDAGRWFDRLAEAAAGGKVPAGALRAWLDEIASLLADHLVGRAGPPIRGLPCCPITWKPSLSVR